METTPVETTPTTPVAPPESSAAPATSAPTPAPVTGQPAVERPKSMKEALQREAAKTESQTPVPPAVATQPPAVTPQPGATKPLAGQLPDQKDWPRILGNARAQRDAEWKKEIGVMAEMTPEERGYARNILRDIKADPVVFTTRLVAQMLQGPARDVLRAQLAPIFGNGHEQAQPTNDLNPDVEIRNEQGQVVGHSFSAQKTRALIQQAVEEAIGKEVSPLKSDLQRRQEAQQQQEQQAREQRLEQARWARTDATMEEIADILGVKLTDASDLWEALHHVQQEHPDWSPHRAALHVQKTKVTPRQQGVSTQAAISEMQRRAAGSMTPQSGAGATPKKPTNEKELAAWMRAREATGGKG